MKHEPYLQKSEKVVCLFYFHPRCYLCRLTVARRVSLVEQEMPTLPNYIR